MSGPKSPLESLTIIIDMDNALIFSLSEPDAEATMVTLVNMLDWACLEKCVRRSTQLQKIDMQIFMPVTRRADEPVLPSPLAVRPKIGPSAFLQERIRSKVSPHTGTLLRFQEC